MNLVEALRLFVIGFGALLAFIFLSLLMRNLRRMPEYTLAEARQIVQTSRTEALIMLAVIPVSNIVAWLLFGRGGSLNTFIIILCVVDGLCFLNVLYELQKMQLAKKRIERIKLNQEE
jgi:hypothetical protein